MYKVTHFRKTLMIENNRPYGIIKVYFGPNSNKSTGRISLQKFMALSHILENDNVGYNPQKRIFATRVEPSAFVNPPNRTIS